jgi:hypothetical protein
VTGPDLYQNSTSSFSLQPPVHPLAPSDYQHPVGPIRICRRGLHRDHHCPVHIEPYQPSRLTTALHSVTSRDTPPSVVCTASPRVVHTPARFPSFPADRHHGPSVHIVGRLLHSGPSQRHTQYTQAHARYGAQCHSARCAHTVHSVCSRGGAGARGAAASHAQHAHTHGGLALLVATTLLIRLVVPTAPPPLRPISLSLPLVCCTHHLLLAESLAFARPPARPR